MKRGPRQSPISRWKGIILLLAAIAGADAHASRPGRACVRFWLSVTHLVAKLRRSEKPAVPRARLPDVPVPNFAAFQELFARSGVSADSLVRHALGSSSLGAGLNARSFPLPGFPDYCLLTSHEDFRAFQKTKTLPPLDDLTEIPDWAPNENYGQQIARLGPFRVLKFQPGKPMGMARNTPWDPRSPEHVRALAEYRQRLKESAALPQEAYDELTRQYEHGIRAGANFDLGKADNLLLDFTRKQFGFVDVAAPKGGTPFTSPRKMIEQMRIQVMALPEPQKAEALQFIADFERVELGNGSRQLDVAPLALSLMDNSHAAALAGDQAAIRDRKIILTKLALAADRHGQGFGIYADSSVGYSFETAGIKESPAQFRERVTSGAPTR